MGEETKFIINELNIMLNKNYNVSSFENLNCEEILQVVCDVLVQFEAIISVDAVKNTDNAIIMIVEALQNIKYVPKSSVTPEEFRNGIALGNRAIIRPILHWLLSHPKQVRKRAYLAKYVEKVECPPEMLDDPDVRQVYNQYESLIESFWKAYNENVKVTKTATEVRELQQDIAKMEEDITRLRQRIKQQREKIENIPNKEVILSVVRSYQIEVNEQRKLEEQILEQKELQGQIESEIKELKSVLAYKKAGHAMNLEPVQQIKNELRSNEILQSQLEQEIESNKKVLEVYETVVKSSDLTDQEVNELNTELSKITSDIQVLIERQNANNETVDNQIVMFRNQAAIIGNKKQDISNTVMDLKNKISILDEEIAKKEELLVTLVGGPLLQGDNLKKYVAKLRENNVVYKEYKSQLRSLTNELGVLTRTLDVLKLSDPSLEEVLSKTVEDKNKVLENTTNDTDDLKLKIKKIAAEIDQVRAETTQLREELRSSNNEMQPILSEYNKLKEVFEDVTEAPTKELNQLNTDMKILEEQIKVEEEKWKKMHQENERKNELLIRLSEDIVNSGDELNKQPTQMEILKERLAHQKKMKLNLQKELDYLEIQKAESQRNLEVLERIIKLLKAKN